MAHLTGKVAVVTGGASGIGLATASLLVEHGASVVVVDLDATSAERAAEKLGPAAAAAAADVGDPADWQRVVAAARDAFGGIDFAHLNAGVVTGESELANVTDAQYRRIMGANLDGVFYGARAVIPEIAARGGGAIVATSSLAGLIAFDPDPVYTLTKHGVVGLVKALAPQLQAKGITVNCVCPGIVATPLVGDEGIARLEEAGFPVIAPDDIASAVVACMTGTETGQAYVCQAGAEPVAYRFHRVPGPRAAGHEGQLPPDDVAAWDQR